MIEAPREQRARYLRGCRLLSLASAATAAFYLWWLLVDARPDNPVLYRVLLGAELFNITQVAGFWYTISSQRWTEPLSTRPTHSEETVDAFVTVYDEPSEVVEETRCARPRPCVIPD